MYDCTRVAVPLSERDVAEYDWKNFPPKRFGSRQSFTIIDEATGIEGKLIATNVFIHGQLDGVAFAEQVTVEKTGRLKGLIFCRTLMVFGHVEANIICDSVRVRTGGVLAGGLKYRDMMIEAGGTVSGSFEKRVVLDSKRGIAQTRTAESAMR